MHEDYLTSSRHHGAYMQPLSWWTLTQRGCIYAVRACALCPPSTATSGDRKASDAYLRSVLFTCNVPLNFLEMTNQYPSTAPSFLLTIAPMNLALLTSEFCTLLLTADPCTVCYILQTLALWVAHYWPLHSELLCPNRCILCYYWPLNSGLHTAESRALRYFWALNSSNVSCFLKGPC